MKIYTDSVTWEVAKGQEWRGSGVGRVAHLQSSLLVECAMYKLRYTSVWVSLCRGKREIALCLESITVTFSSRK